MKFRSLKKVAAISLIFAFACCFSILSAALDAPATGSVTVNVAPATEGIVLRLYEVANIENEQFKLNDDFAASDVDITNLKTAEDAQNAANALESFAKSSSFKTSTDVAINSDGQALFADLLVDKVYLIYQPDEAEFYIQPMLVRLPLIDDTSAVYNITVNAKFVDNAFAYRSAVILNKVDDSKKPLEGAEFSLQSKSYYKDVSLVPDDTEKGTDAAGSYYWKEYGSNLTTDNNGQIVVEKMPFGTYRFIEVKAPDGYILDSEPHEFELSVGGSVKVENGIYIKDMGTIAELTVTNIPVPTSNPSEPSNPSNPSNPSEPSNPSAQATLTTSTTSTTPPPPTTSTSSSQPGNWVLTGDSVNVLSFLFVVIVAGLVITLAAKRTSKNKADR